MNDMIRLMVVEDSKLIRRAVCRIFEGDPRLQVVGEAANGREALDMLPDLNPDVITLDVLMPEMDGISTLKRIMIQHPKPTVMLSNVTLEGARMTFDTLKYGAVDFIPKPSNLRQVPGEVQQQDMIRRVRLAADVQMDSIRYVRTPRQSKSEKRSGNLQPDFVVAIGAAEGGYGVLLKLVPNIDPDLPAALLVSLHAEPAYVDAFAAYLNECSPIEVKRALDGDGVRAGTCYMASGKEYATLRSDREQLRLIVHPAPFGDRRGAVNMLMLSTADTMRDHSAGVLLTGSEEDGVEGMGEIIRSGGRCLIQDPATCLHKQTVLHALSKYKPTGVIADTRLAAEINTMPIT